MRIWTCSFLPSDYTDSFAHKIHQLNNNRVINGPIDYAIIVELNLFSRHVAFMNDSVEPVRFGQTTGDGGFVLRQGRSDCG